ncbi:hypothetical protein [Pseudobutyrivibrio xylanivorans]|uniref:DUF998 domain-containing protein n=1 Tax=Pseudobutyrivibrio xylanivorans TaxID=185007 RepID=A0A1G5S1A3_PSEXY|nr:hypothetical protein [Pseudobutyrivibrio xylanivorans]SCZ80093.1 hypothetical protein SAMN02910350_02114 [Pseudobutyrivibrio xylanivorans]
MHDVIVSNINIILWVVSVAELGLVYVFANELKQKRNLMVVCMLAVAVGLTFDAFVVALGGIIDEFPIIFSRLRYIMHGTMVPLVLPICGYSLKLKKKGMCLVWIITVILMILGLVQSLNVELVETVVGENVRMATGPGTPVWARVISRILSFGTIIPLIISGAIVWKKFKISYMFTGGILMFVFAALGPATGNMDLLFLISMFGEVCMLACYYFYLKSLYGELYSES